MVHHRFLLLFNRFFFDYIDHTFINFRVLELSIRDFAGKKTRLSSVPQLVRHSTHCRRLMTSIIYIPGSVGLVSDMPRAGLMSSETNVCKRLCVAVRYVLMLIQLLHHLFVSTCRHDIIFLPKDHLNRTIYLTESGKASGRQQPIYKVWMQGHDQAPPDG